MVFSFKVVEVDCFVVNFLDGGVVVLVFGFDIGFVLEWVICLVEKVLEGDSDLFNFIKLDVMEFSVDLSCLIDEVLIVFLFGGWRIVWIKDVSSKNFVFVVELVLKFDDW